MDDYENRQVRRYRQARTVADLTEPDLPEFTVMWWTPQGDRIIEKRELTGQQAVMLAKNLTDRPAARIGVFARIIITDAGDHTVFEWKHGLGVTYPTKEMRDAHAAANRNR